MADRHDRATAFPMVVDRDKAGSHFQINEATHAYVGPSDEEAAYRDADPHHRSARVRLGSKSAMNAAPV
jgi:hypothetical protein